MKGIPINVKKEVNMRLIVLYSFLLFVVISNTYGLSNNKVKVSNVISFLERNTFYTELDCFILSEQGVVKPLKGYENLDLSTEVVIKYTRVSSQKLLQESLGLINPDHSDKIKKIIFGLENYCLQVYAFNKGNHDLINIVASKLDDLVSIEEVESSLNYVSGGGELFFRIQIECRNKDVQSIRLVLNQDF